MSVLEDPELHAIVNATGGFGHRQHINLAYLAVRRYGMPAALDAVCGWLRQITRYARAPQKYHHTVSQAWVRLVAHHVAEEPDGTRFDTFIERNPALLDKRLLSRHYHSTTLAAAPARQGWIEPDLQPFPWT